MVPKVSEQFLNHCLIEHSNVLLPAHSNSTSSLLKECLCCVRARNVLSAQYTCMQQWTGEATLGDALYTTLQRLPDVKFVVTTLGKRGSVLLERCPNQQHQGEAVLNERLDSMLDEVNESRTSINGNNGSNSLGCAATNSTYIR